MRVERFDFEVDDWIVTAEVSEEHDPYGTGDSPTFLYVNIISIFDNETGKYLEVDGNKLEYLEDMAIDIYQE